MRKVYGNKTTHGFILRYKNELEMFVARAEYTNDKDKYRHVTGSVILNSK